jgi:hypothetical protein
MSRRHHRISEEAHSQSEQHSEEDSASSEQDIQRLHQAQYKQFREALSPFWAWRQRDR